MPCKWWPLLVLLEESTALWSPTYVKRASLRGVVHVVHRRCSNLPIAHLGAMSDRRIIELEHERNAALNECKHLRTEVAAAREAQQAVINEAKVKRAVVGRAQGAARALCRTYMHMQAAEECRSRRASHLHIVPACHADPLCMQH